MHRKFRLRRRERSALSRGTLSGDGVRKRRSWPASLPPCTLTRHHVETSVAADSTRLCRSSQGPTPLFASSTVKRTILPATNTMGCRWFYVTAPQISPLLECCAQCITQLQIMASYCTALPEPSQGEHSPLHCSSVPVCLRGCIHMTEHVCACVCMCAHAYVALASLWWGIVVAFAEPMWHSRVSCLKAKRHSFESLECQYQGKLIKWICFKLGLSFY